MSVAADLDRLPSGPGWAGGRRPLSTGLALAQLDGVLVRPTRARGGRPWPEE